jgi:hypothetical protein
MTTSYLRSLSDPIEPGNVVVHNQVRPTRVLGSRGFRVWQQRPDEEPAIEPCPCDWAPELGVHYRVKAVRPYDGGAQQSP